MNYPTHWCLVYLVCMLSSRLLLCPAPTLLAANVSTDGAHVGLTVFVVGFLVAKGISTKHLNTSAFFL